MDIETVMRSGRCLKRRVAQALYCYTVLNGGGITTLYGTYG